VKRVSATRGNVAKAAIHATNRHKAGRMKFSRRIALLTFMVALVIILAIGFYRAASHDDPRPDTGTASPSSTPG